MLQACIKAWYATVRNGPGADRKDMSTCKHACFIGGLNVCARVQGLGLAPVLCEHLEAMNFTAPTRIQQATLPVLLVCHALLALLPSESISALEQQCQLPHFCHISLEFCCSFHMFALPMFSELCKSSLEVFWYTRRVTAAVLQSIRSDESPQGLLVGLRES